MQELRKMDRPVKKIMISGGSEIGLRLARSLEKDYQVKLIEANEDRAKELAALLENTLVLRGEENKHELLREENISEVDLFIATNRNNERNIIASLLAKRMGAHRVISVFNQQMYVNLLEGSNIDIVIVFPFNFEKEIILKEKEFIKRDMGNSFRILQKNGIMWMDDYLGGDGITIRNVMNTFLEEYNGKYEMIHRGYQLAIRKC